MVEIEDRFQCAQEAALQAGVLLLQRRKKMLSVEPKGRTDFKVAADDASDHLIRQMILSKFLHDAIISEEGDFARGGDEYYWIVDPLDGTIPYTYATSNHFSVSIGIKKRDKMVAGVIFAPARREIYTAKVGCGAFCNGEPMRAWAPDDFQKSIILTDRGKVDRQRIVPYINCLQSQSGVASVVCYAASACSFALVASGHLHGAVTVGLDLWDTAAASVIMLEAGVRLTTVKGEEWKLGDGSLMAAHPNVHDRLLKLFEII